MKRRLKASVLFIVLGLLLRIGALKRPGIVTGAFALGYGASRGLPVELFREPGCSTRIPLGRPDDGNAAVHSADAWRRRRPYGGADA